jgi:hypothetical protein
LRDIEEKEKGKVVERKHLVIRESEEAKANKVINEGHEERENSEAKLERKKRDTPKNAKTPSDAVNPNPYPHILKMLP